GVLLRRPTSLWPRRRLCAQVRSTLAAILRRNDRNSLPRCRACSDPMIVPLAISSAAYKLEVPLGTMTADMEVNYRLDRTLAQLEEFVNDMLITKLPPIRNRIREVVRPASDRRGGWLV